MNVIEQSERTQKVYTIPIKELQKKLGISEVITHVRYYSEAIELTTEWVDKND